MKIRPSVYLFCAVVILLIILIIWFAKRPTPAPVETAIPPQAITNAPVLANKPVTANPPGVPHFVHPTINPAEEKERAEERQKTFEAENIQPIIFYGKLEDQFGNPVVGAEIEGFPQLAQGTTNVFTTSDNNGLFTLDAGEGKGMGIAPQKAGYAVGTTDTYFRYSLLYANHITPDPNNPIVIKMWKLQGAQPLVHINQQYKLHYTDTPINFDLLAGQIVPSGGDIQITLNRSPGVVSGSTRQEWGVQVEAVNGGLLEANGEEGVTFQAPSSGYQLSDSFVMSTNAPNKWFGGFDKAFFLKSRAGQVYSKIDFNILINQNPGDYVYIEFHGVANTNSSGNWEATVPQ